MNQISLCAQVVFAILARGRWRLRSRASNWTFALRNLATRTALQWMTSACALTANLLALYVSLWGWSQILMTCRAFWLLRNGCYPEPSKAPLQLLQSQP